MTIVQELSECRSELAEWIESDYDCVRPRRGDMQEGVIAWLGEDEAIIHLSEAMKELIGETLSLVVLEVNQQRRRLVLLERVADT
jgi:hypothetical protein